MELYEAIEKRRTVREFDGSDVPFEKIERMISAGLKAPTNDHRRNWEFVILHTQKEKETGLRFILEKIGFQEDRLKSMEKGMRLDMYEYAVPRQYSMLRTAPYVILPFFKGTPALFGRQSVNLMNPLASIWCVNENMFLAAAAEGLATSVRIPVGDEGEKVRKELGVPEGYVLASYIGVGVPRKTALRPAQFEIDPADRMHLGKW